MPRGAVQEPGLGFQVSAPAWFPLPVSLTFRDLSVFLFTFGALLVGIWPGGPGGRLWARITRVWGVLLGEEVGAPGAGPVPAAGPPGGGPPGPPA